MIRKEKSNEVQLLYKRRDFPEGRREKRSERPGGGRGEGTELAGRKRE